MLNAFRTLFAPPRHLILLILAAWIGLSMAEKRTEGRGLSREHLNNLIFNGLITFILAGRIVYVLEYLSIFLKSPLGIFSVNPDLFDPLGGAAVALMAAMIYGQRQSLPLWPTLDALVPFLAIIAAGLGLSHLATGTAFGRSTDLPWGIDLWNAKRHPTQVYEILASLLTFALFWTKKPGSRPGVDFLLFAAITAGWHLFLGAFRGDSTVLILGARQTQVLAWFALVAIFIALELRLKRTKNG